MYLLWPGPRLWISRSTDFDSLCISPTFSYSLLRASLRLSPFCVPPVAPFFSSPPQAANNSREQSPMRRPITSTTRRDGFPNTEWYMPVCSYLVDFVFWQALYGRGCPAVMSTVSRCMSRFVRDNQQDTGVRPMPTCAHGFAETVVISVELRSIATDRAAKLECGSRAC